MLLLMVFALVAGAGTAITPCVLPVLPALLSASAAGGRRRPLGIVLGLAVTFTIAIVALAQLVKGVGLAAGAARTLAIVVLLAFGVILRGPDPGGGDLGERHQRRLGPRGRDRPRLRGRPERDDAALRARRPRGARPRAPAHPRPRRRTHPRRGAARHRGGDGHESRCALRVGAGQG